MKEEVLRLASDNETVVRSWHYSGTPRAVVAGIHGFAEHSGRYNHFGEFLAERGFDLYMYDLRGHGLSRSERGYVDSFNDFIHDTVSFIEYVKKRSGASRVFLFGHSMGGLIAVNVAAILGDDLEGLITSGAALEVRTTLAQGLLLSILGSVSPKKRIRLPIATECLTSDESVVRRYIEDPLVFKDPTVKLLVEFGRAVQEAWRKVDAIRCPALILHGEGDCLVPASASRNLYERLRVPDKTLVVYKGMRHEILNEPEWTRVAGDIVEWLNRHLI
ncbi:alpha/beta hydrolase [Infirmifilum lucidum]|uniref:Alpha/beta hydrolase n=1 Tax=Infirmifilum lucidum TaxID=2776706 RepID=A0A7L9FJ51_9CREN|nr:alpha/beta hydrolase [Infirmifilum lucidum]QOJ78926.1 alpha/beta hydrolase [Infirmifilum lucidum]